MPSAKSARYTSYNYYIPTSCPPLCPGRRYKRYLPGHIVNVNHGPTQTDTYNFIKFFIDYNWKLATLIRQVTLTKRVAARGGSNQILISVNSSPTAVTLPIINLRTPERDLLMLSE